VDRPEIIAHRGASAYAPEHSIAAYDLALAQGADLLELDIRATADGELVVLHDPTLQRTAGDGRRIAALTRAGLAALPAELRPVTLDAVLGRYGGATRLLVELKDPEPWWEGRVLAAVARHGLADRVVLQSFDARALRRLHAQAPQLACAPLLRRPPSAARLASLAAWATAVGVWHPLVDARLVAAAHARGLAVRAWTANAPGAIARLLALGVDGVITDVPDVALGLARPATLPLAA
jgi:glycerophosphoryl diester phosphodiesterase